MRTISRRRFLGGAALGLAGAVAPLRAFPLGMQPGFQVYPVRQALAADFAGTLRQLAAIGYKTVEMCSPPGYVSNGFGPLAKMTASEMRQTIGEAGLRCDSCHYNFTEMKEHLDDRIAFAKELGLSQMILSTFWLPQTATMDDYRRAAGELNRMAVKISAAGMQCGFHNHNFEFKEIDGQLIYDELMKEFDARLVKMQFQVAVISIGFEAATYMEKYPGRFISLHLADWNATEKKQAAVGKGVVDWKKLFEAAKKGGVKNYYVEMGLDLMRESYPYLRDL